MRRVASRPARLAQTAIALIVLAMQAKADEVIPPAPSDHFHDYAGVASPDTAASLDKSLAQFERETSKHLVMVVYPKMQSAAYVGDYARRIVQSWRLGPDSAVFFIFMQDKKTFLVAGDGLRSAFRDDTFIGISRRIMAVPLDEHEYDRGLSLGVEAMIIAARDQQRAAHMFWPLLWVLPLGALVVWRARRTVSQPARPPAE